ncbi:MAG: SDR family NAD(P)-dependent oxidoreductase [Bacilli bacterium]
MKVTLITGAASGLGRELSYLFARDGNHLLLIDIHIEGLKETKQEIEKINSFIHVDLLEVDLSDLNSYKKIYNYTEEKNYFINNLVNCAGFGDCCDINKMNIDKQLTMTNVNCNALLYFTKVFLDKMLEKNEGHIINISSIAGFMPGPFTSSFVKQAHNDYTFTKIKPVSAKTVALYGYKKSQKGKKVAIVGFKNKLIIFATRFFPRSLITLISAKNIRKNK